MYTGSLQSGLPLSHPHLKACVKWGEIVINYEAINNHPFPRDLVGTKVHACKWLAGIHQRRGDPQAAKDQRNGIYQGSRDPETAKDYERVDSTNQLIQKSIENYEKAAQILESHSETSYGDLSAVYLIIAQMREKYLPENSTLADVHSKKLIKALEHVIAFHSSVPEHRKTTEKYISPSHAMLELDRITGKKTEEQAAEEEEKLDQEYPPTHMWELGERSDADRTTQLAISKLCQLYAKIPKSRTEEPDYFNAAVWLGRLRRHDSATSDLLINPRIQQAQKEVQRKLPTIIDRTHASLVKLTNTYLSKKDIDPCKRIVFRNLLSTLTDPKTSSKQEQIIAYRTQLELANKNMLNAHRTPTWVRYFSTAMSFLFLLPAAIKAIDSYKKYNTIKFWKPESKRAVECAENICAQMGYMKNI